VVTSIEELTPKARVKGTVKRTELYGAFIDLGVGVDALIHISQLGKKRVNRVTDVMNVGDEVTVWIDRVDAENNQISATMLEPQPVDWRDLKAGQAYAGTITRLERFGVFVDIGAEKEGLVHVSELSHEFVRNPSQIARVGDKVNVKVLGFNKKKRRIDLSVKALLEAPEAEEEVSFAEIDDEDETVELPSAMEIAWRRAMGKDPSAEDRSASARRGRKRKEQLRQQQDDILSRTLTAKLE
jgi:ribosomal protein S1